MSKTLLIMDGDVVLDASGRFITVEGAVKRDQDIGLALSSQYDPARDWGNEALDDIGSTPVNGLPAHTLLTRGAVESIQRLRRFQYADKQSTPEERIAKIEQFNLYPLGLTAFAYVLHTRSEDGNTAAQSRRLSMEHQRLPADLLESLLENR